MAAQPTTDHDEIRQWVEQRGGHPARVKATGKRNDPGILRIDFPGYSGEDTLEEIDWDEWLEAFEKNKLALILDEDSDSRFSKLVSRAAAKKRAPAKRSAAKKAAPAKKASAKKAPAKKAAAKKAPAKKAPAKKAPAKKAPAKKAPAKKASAKKASAKKASVKKAPAKKASSRKAPAKKTSPKKVSATKAPARKAAAKKAAPARRVIATKKRAASSSTTTTDHDEIRSWVEARGGFPAHVKQTGRNRKDLGVLRIDYPGFSGKDTLERIGWDDWFDAFDRNKLAFLYQDKRNSRFSKLVSR